MTDDASLARNQFPSKTICDQIRLHRSCGGLMLLNDHWQKLVEERTMRMQLMRRATQSRKVRLPAHNYIADSASRIKGCRTGLAGVGDKPLSWSRSVFFGHMRIVLKWPKKTKWFLSNCLQIEANCSEFSYDCWVQSQVTPNKYIRAELIFDPDGERGLFR